MIPKTFTALQIAAVLDAHSASSQQAKRRVKKLLIAARNGKLRRDHRGQKVLAWPVAGLPHELRRRLEQLTSRGGYENVAKLLEDQSGPWRPHGDEDSISERQVLQAKGRCQALSRCMPFLASHSMSDVIAKAMPSILADFTLRGTSERAARVWIERALRRDRNREEWGRWELYLDEKVTCAPATSAPSENDVVSITLLELCKSVDAKLSGGAALPEALQAARCELRKHPHFAGLSSDAVRKALHRAWRKFSEEGTVKDRREFSGRRSVAEIIPEEDIQRIRTATAEGSSRSQALHFYAKSARCPESVKEVIEKLRTSRHNLPDKLIALATPTPEMIARSRGRRQAELVGYTVPRDASIVLENGTRRPIEPGDVWELDDMSVNNPFWFANQEGTDELARKHGVGMGRQGLYAMDLATGRWLGVMLVAREKDAYRSSDILSFLHQLMSLYGMPRVGFRFEMGSWMSKLLNESEFGLSTDEGRDSFRMKLADELGLVIKFARSAKAKGSIESGFGYLQRSLIHFVDSPSYGKVRGERRDDCIKLQRARSGAVHPRDIGVLSQGEMLTKLTEVFSLLNSEKKEGRIQRGEPDQRWEEATARLPLRPLPEEKAHLLLPNCAELNLRGGSVQPTFEGERLTFSNPEAFAQLGNRYRVVVRYDAGAPGMGAAILNADASSKNLRGYRPGEYICHADLIASAPAFNASRFYDENIGMKRRYKRALSTMFAAPGVCGLGGRFSSEVRDGLGNVSRMERGGIAMPLTPIQPDEAAMRGNRLKRDARALAAPYDEEAEAAEIEKLAAAEARAYESGALLRI